MIDDDDDDDDNYNHLSLMYLGGNTCISGLSAGNTAYHASILLMHLRLNLVPDNTSKIFKKTASPGIVNNTSNIVKKSASPGIVLNVGNGLDDEVSRFNIYDKI